MSGVFASRLVDGRYVFYCPRCGLISSTSFETKDVAAEQRADHIRSHA